jgi:hypothetical protein
MTTFLVTIRCGGHEREVYQTANSAADAIAQVRKTMTDYETRWAAVFAG